MSDSAAVAVYSGEVVWFHVEYGYGFIAWSKNGIKQKDMFAHFSDVAIEGFKLLKAGQQVEFAIGTNNEGLPKATEIVIISYNEDNTMKDISSALQDEDYD